MSFDEWWRQSAFGTDAPPSGVLVLWKGHAQAAWAAGRAELLDATGKSDGERLAAAVLSGDGGALAPLLDWLAEQGSVDAAARARIDELTAAARDAHAYLTHAVASSQPVRDGSLWRELAALRDRLGGLGVLGPAGQGVVAP